MKLSHVIFCTFLLVAASCNEQKKTSPYPITEKVDTVDNYFGVQVSDPYRWLENDTSKGTADWVGAQNKVTFSYLDQIPYRDRVQKRLEELVNYERLSAPFKEGDYYYFYKNDGLQNHSVLYRKKGLDGAAEVFLDPNTFSKDATTSMAGLSFSKDGSLAAYLISEGGSDWRKAIVIRASDKKILEDTLRDIKFSGLSWKGNEGFFYSSYDKPKGSALSAKTQQHKLYYHRLATSQASDELIFGEDKPRRYVGGDVTDDERYLIVTAATSTTTTDSTTTSTTTTDTSTTSTTTTDTSTTSTTTTDTSTTSTTTTQPGSCCSCR